MVATNPIIREIYSIEKTTLTSFEAVFHRLGTVGMKTQKQLADALGITPAAVNNAKRKRIFPEVWAVRLGSQLDLSVDWLLGFNVSQKRTTREMIVPQILGLLDKLPPSAKTNEKISEAIVDILKENSMLELLPFIKAIIDVLKATIDNLGDKRNRALFLEKELNKKREEIVLLKKQLQDFQ